MLTTCLACHRPFPANETVEHFPVGKRVAFDPRRGRLWAVCPSCARWTLAPFETRWEALEELERLTQDRARLLAETDNIGLLAVDDIEVVRVGRAGLREESWWRFGAEFAARRRRANRQVLKGKIINAAIFLVLAGVPFPGDGRRWIARDRKKRFGKELWRGEPARCPRCGHAMATLRFDDYGQLVIRPHDQAAFAVAVPCARCGAGADDAVALTGVPAEHILRRTLAYANFAGGTEETVREAVERVESYESTDEMLRSIADRRPALGAMDTEGAFALEIALNADVEHRLLEMELAELEARWRYEEEIAAIADTL